MFFPSYNRALLDSAEGLNAVGNQGMGQPGQQSNARWGRTLLGAGAGNDGQQQGRQ